MNPAHNGDAALVPPINPLVPVVVLECHTTQSESATIATSGPLRCVVEPRFAVMLIPRCQIGIGKFGLIVPPLPPQPVSDAHGPPAPLVVSTVPPTSVKLGLSSQPNGTASNPLSPLASNTDC